MFQIEAESMRLFVGQVAGLGRSYSFLPEERRESADASAKPGSSRSSLVELPE